MTDYRNLDLNNLVDKPRKNNNYSSNEDHKLVSKNIESDSLVQTYKNFIDTFTPDLAAKNPDTFAFYGKAEKYYSDASYNIINYYPFDGTREEVISWYTSSAPVDVAIFKKYWPGSVGHIEFSSNEYVQFFAGPQTHPDAEFVGQYRKGESALKIDPSKGNTVEFWLKKSAWAGSPETVFEIGSHPDKVTADSRATFKVVLSAASGSSVSPIYATYTVGASSDASGINLGSTAVTPDTVADSKWHHYAIVASKRSSKVKFKLYIDGKYDSTTFVAEADSFPATDNCMAGTIATNLGSTAGNLTGSMDDFRFWKGKRTGREISRYFDQKIYASDITKDNYTSRLGVYYKFNKENIGTNSVDSLVVDFSGNDMTGRIKNFNTRCRESTSAINLSEVSLNTEILDPILDSSNTRVVALNEELSKIGKSYDIHNNNLLINFLPDWARDAYGDKSKNESSEFYTLVHLLAKEFDEIKLNIDSIRRVGNRVFTGQSVAIQGPQSENQSSVTYLDNTLFGCSDIEIVEDVSPGNRIDFAIKKSENIGFEIKSSPFESQATLEEGIEGIVNNLRLSNSIDEAKKMLLENVYIAITSLMKKKGTENSINGILSAWGIDKDLASLNIYGHNSEIDLNRKKKEITILEKNSINFSNNMDGSLYMTGGLGNEEPSVLKHLETRRFIEGIKKVNADNHPHHGMTFEGTFIFPSRTAENFSITGSSIFGVHKVDSSGTPSYPASADRKQNLGQWTDFHVYVDKPDLISTDAKFQLRIGDQTIESNYIKNVYENTVWNISARLEGPTGSISADGTERKDNTFLGNDSLANASPKIIFSGYNYILDNLNNSFSVTKDITQSRYNTLMSASKSPYIGAARTNFEGEVLNQTDIKILNFNAWADSLTNEELQQRAKKISSTARSDIHQYQNEFSSRNHSKENSLIFSLDFSNLKELDSSNKFQIQDASSGSIECRDKYGPLLGWKHPFESTSINTNTGSILQREFLPCLEDLPVENLYGSDGVEIKTLEKEKFDIGIKSEIKMFSLEKSMYKTISKKMLSLLADIQSLSNILGNATNKYRQEYKDIKYLKRKFFESVENENQFERFVEYYKWIDSALGHMIEQMLPASSVSNTGMHNVVESHVLERNKYQHKLQDIKHLEYDIEGGAATSQPLPWSENSVISDSDVHPNWRRVRQAREDADKGREKLRTVYGGDTITIQNGHQGESNTKEYSWRTTVTTSDKNPFKKDLTDTGHSRSQRSTETSNDGKVIVITSESMQEASAKHKLNNDTSTIPEEEYYNPTVTEKQDEEYRSDAKSTLPFTLKKDETASDMDPVAPGVRIVNNHKEDNGSAQGPWTKSQSGGPGHRRVPYGTEPQDRAESYKIEFTGGDEPTMEVSNSDSGPRHWSKGAPTVYNEHNVKTFNPIGNYDFDYEIVLTSGRANNNKFLISNKDSFVKEQPTVSSLASELVDYKVPSRKKTQHVIVNRFSAPGSPETAASFGKDRESEEFSVYNTINYRNLLIRETLNTFNSERNDKFGYRPDSSTNASYHRVHRNPTRYISNEVNKIRYDNGFIQSAIPTNDFSYSWVTKSATDTVYEFIDKNNNFGYQNLFEIPGSLESSETINFVSESANNPRVSFVGLNSVAQKTVQSDENTVSFLSTHLNDQILNIQGPYGWPSWKQIRASESPAARILKKNNTISISKRGKQANVKPHPGLEFKYGDTKENKNKITEARTISNHYDPVLTTKFSPLVAKFAYFDQRDFSLLNSRFEHVSQDSLSQIWQDEEILHTQLIKDKAEKGNKKTKIVSMKASVQGNVSSFGNLELIKDLKYREKDILQDLNFEKINSFLSISKLNTIKTLSYKEVIYPREVNTHRIIIKDRPTFNFFGWKAKRSERQLFLSGNIDYGSFLLSSSTQAAFPEYTVIKEEKSFEKSFGSFDAVDLPSADTSTALQNIRYVTMSSWPLDSRAVFSTLPTNITCSYFTEGEHFLANRDQGTRGEGILQNDYNIFTLGYNGLRGAPPPVPLYNRRVPQDHNYQVYLAGEAKWEAADNAQVGPFYDNYEDYAKNLNAISKGFSLIPEFTISRYIEDVYKSGDFNTGNTEDDFLHLPGAIYENSSGEVSIGKQFFKTFSTTDALKYFNIIVEDFKESRGELSVANLTLRCRAAKRFLPYRGFYPAERVVQISEIFNRGYLRSDSYTSNYIENGYLSNVKAQKYFKLRIENSKTQAIKPLFAPGVIMNSIKAGLAVDYPIFSSSVSGAVENILASNLTSSVNSFSALALGSSTSFTGSEINSTKDQGIPRIKGSVERRINFSDVLDPARLLNAKLYDNEPHPSATLLYGGAEWTRVLDRPAIFGSFNKDELKKSNAIDFDISSEGFSRSMLAYKSAINNFTSETVKFFLKDEKLKSLVSEPTNPLLNKGVAYKMRVYINNRGVTMYDRHSAFGPPVDEGDVQITNYISQVNTSVAATAVIDVNTTSLSSLDFGTVSLTDADGTAITYIFSQDGFFLSGQTDSQGRVTIQIKDLTTTSAIAAEFQAAIESSSGHAGSIIVTRSNNRLNLQQQTNGISGNTTITKSLTSESALTISSAFSGGTQSEGQSFLTGSTSTKQDSHGYLPYVPPFLDPETRPYAEITFTPTETKTYTIPFIIDNSTVTYYNIASPSNATLNTNYKESMNVSASVDFKRYIKLYSDNYKTNKQNVRIPDSDSEKYRWVIQPRWETPVLDFTNSEVSALSLSDSTVTKVSGSPWKNRYQNNYYNISKSGSIPYLTASTGMWHQSGTVIPEGNPTGYYLTVESQAENISSNLGDLASAVGFTKKKDKVLSDLDAKSFNTQKLGLLAENKKIYESVVAIPYYTDKHDKVRLFPVSDKIVSQATEINNSKKDELYISLQNSKNKPELDAYRKEYLEWFNSTGISGADNIAYQLRMMDKYILPPHFDFQSNSNVEPHIIYFFQFQQDLGRDDLARIWQNMYPSSPLGPGTALLSKTSKNKNSSDTEYVSSILDISCFPKSEFFRSPYENVEDFLKQKVRWLIFKVKYRAEKFYENVQNFSVMEDLEDIEEVNGIRLSSEKNKYLGSETDQQLFSRFGYNWPYDFFSLVEYVKVEEKIDFSSRFAQNRTETASAVSDNILETPETQETPDYDFEPAPSATNITTVQNYQLVSNNNSPTQQVVSTGGSFDTETLADSMVIRKALKEDTAPSPGNTITVTGDLIRSGTESLYVNGILQRFGANNDYIISGNTITFTYTLESGDSVYITYIKQ